MKVQKANRYRNLTRAIRKFKPQTILEVGTHRGSRAVEMINYAKQYNNDIKYYGFDLFEDMTPNVKEREFHGKCDVTREEAENKISKTGSEYELIVGNTIDTMPDFNPDRPIDFVFIDGGHSIATIASDWSNIERIMSDHTIVLFDDYYENRDDVGCKSLIDSLIKQNVFVVDLLDPLDKLSVKKLKRPPLVEWKKDALHIRLVMVSRI